LFKLKIPIIEPQYYEKNLVFVVLTSFSLNSRRFLALKNNELCEVLDDLVVKTCSYEI
jgi:hypothetical protein